MIRTMLCIAPDSKFAHVTPLAQPPPHHRHTIIASPSKCANQSLRLPTLAQPQPLRLHACAAS
ncbi:hypothetical protein JHK87_020832 [Glycine soja]|nr:hypothetical protein JHK87_020832 [Glycine soja]